MITFEEYENALKQRHGERIYNILSHSSVAIAGLGGLGSNIAMYLARAGVGHLHLVDFDKVDITNLNRQQYDIADLGTLKTDALTKNIKRFNPFIEITSQCVKVNEDNAAEIFGGYKIVCEAFDKAENNIFFENNNKSWRRTWGTLPRVPRCDKYRQSSLIVAENDKFDELEWLPKLQEKRIDFNSLEEDLEFRIHPQIKDFLSTYWFMPLEGKTDKIDHLDRRFLLYRW